MKFMKKSLSVVLCLISVVMIFYFTSAASNVDDFAYSTLPDGTVAITKYKGNDKVIAIPDTIEGRSVTAIDFMAFSSCFNVEKIEISKNVKSIADGAFSNCISLKSIEVSNDNASFSVKDNVLFDKNMTQIICYPAKKSGSSYEMPDSVESINKNAFSKCCFLESVDLSENLKKLSAFSFVSCEKLNDIFIYDKIEIIEQNAIDNCSTQLRIYFNGSRTEWDKIVFEGNGREQLNKYFVLKDADRNYIVKLNDEKEITYSSNVPFILKLEDKSILKISNIKEENSSSDFKITANIKPEKAGKTKISAVTENGFVLCNFNFIVEQCEHLHMHFVETEKAATCTEGGTEIYACDDCDFTEKRTVNPTGHSLSEWKVETKATKDREGLEVRVCNNHNWDIKEEKIIHKLPSAEPDDSQGNTSKYMLGDVNGDNKINASDARRILRYLAEFEDLSASGLKAADVDKNNKVNATDARRLLRYIAELGDL